MMKKIKKDFPVRKNDVISLTITGISTDGNGIGRYQNLAVFVPMAVTGDVLQVKIIKLAQNHAYGCIQSIQTPSPKRIEANCPVFQKCGGCAFRQMSYEEELRIKEIFFTDSFSRIGGIPPSSFHLLPILGCDNIDEYRNKVQFPVVQADGRAICGFYAKRSHRVIPCTACYLQPKIFQEIVDTILHYVNQNNISAYQEETHAGTLRHIYLRQGRYSGEIMVCLVVTNITKRLEMALQPLCVVLKQRFYSIQSIILNLNPDKTNVILGKNNDTLWGQNFISDQMCGLEIQLSPHSFYQINTIQAEKLYQIAASFAHPTKEDILLDLYCGAGTIGLSMASQVRKVIGVEIISQAVENARENARRNAIKNATFICSDAKDYAAKCVSEGLTPNIVILDPPRKGVAIETLEAVIQMFPERIVMISCNPATAARDCAYLAQHGYTLKQGQAVDLFPRTNHVEIVVELHQK